MLPERDVIRQIKNKRPRTRNQWLVDAWRDGWREVKWPRLLWARICVAWRNRWNDD